MVYYVWGYNAYSITAVTCLAATCIFYFLMWILPQRFVHRRPAMVTYAFWNVITLSLFIAVCLLLANVSYSLASCSVEIILSICWMLQPFIILYAVRQDSLFWQGLYTNPTYSLFGYSFRGSPIKHFAHAGGAPDLNEPLLGIWDFGRETMGIIAESITTLEKKVVPIIPFTFIQIDSSHFFSGGTARVYRGKYGNESVAVKFLFCLELTTERVADFCAEATLLNSLQHDNVVKCFGVSVMPPAMCLVTEFCLYGSLFDFLHNTDMVITEFTEGHSLDSLYMSGQNRDRLGTGSTGSAMQWMSHGGTGSESASAGDRSSFSSNNSDANSDSRGSFNVGGSYNANNSKHARSLLENLPDIIEGSEYSYDLSQSDRQSDRSSTTTGLSIHSQNALPYNPLLDTASPIPIKVGALRAPIRSTSPIAEKNTVTNVNAGVVEGEERIDYALTIVQAQTTAAETKPVSNNARDSSRSRGSELSADSEACRGAGSGSGHGSGRASGSNANNIRRRRDSAEYFIEKEAIPTAATDRHHEHLQSKTEHTNNVHNISKNILGTNPIFDADTSDAQLTVGLLAAEQSLGSNGSSNTGEGRYSGGFGLNTTGQSYSYLNESVGHVRLRKLSSVMTEDGMGYGPQVNMASLSKNLQEAHAILDGKSNTTSTTARMADHKDAKNNSAPKQRVQSAEEKQNVRIGIDDVEAGSQNRNSTGASQSASGIALRPRSPIGSNLSGTQPSGNQGSESGGGSSSANNFTNAVITPASILIPARIRLQSQGRDNLMNVSAMLAGRDSSRDSSGSSASRSSYGSAGRSSNNAYYNANPTLRPKQRLLVLPLSLRIRMAKDCCAGVAYLHANGFMHCDIKSLNFLVDGDLNVKLSDLGEARASAQASQDIRLFPSNINWSAPEVLSEETIITSAADIWSLAMVITEILTGEVPFDTPEWRSLRMDTFLERLQQGQRPHLLASITEQFPWLTALIAQAWTFSPAERCDSIHMVTIFAEQIDKGFGYQQV